MLKPLADNVVIKMLEMEETTKSGIVLATASKEKSQIAEVIAIGNGEMEDGKSVKMVVKVGDKVVVNKYATTEVEYMDEKYFIVSQKDILAIAE